MDKKKLMKALEDKLNQIVAEEGFQEMADGFNQALNIVKKFAEEDTRKTATKGCGLPPSEWKTCCDSCHDGVWYGHDQGGSYRRNI